MLTASHFIVRGRVQGVGFRYATQREGLRLGLNGWVRNLPDGDVEVMAAGEARQVAALERWLWEGPGEARVRGVIGEEVTPQPPESNDSTGFEIRV